ncbi:MAG: hypothetical protein PHW63_10330 [Alphaproteobacteria bacterium]|nr:hypothetical protein [Alphaproteobacteria bacterium]
MDYRTLLDGYDPQTTKEIVAFLDKVDPSGNDEDLRLLAFRALEGQIITEESYDAHEEAHGYRLQDEQHPIFAYSGGSHPEGQETFFVGKNLAFDNGHAMGETLVRRQPSGKIVAPDAKTLEPDFQAFAALAKMKGIPYLIHARNDGSMLFELAYAYHKAGGAQNEKFYEILAGNKKSLIRNLKKGQSLRPVLLEYIHQAKPVFEAVEKNGLDYYAKRGISLENCANEHEKFKLAMTAEALRHDVEVYATYPDLGPEMAPCLQSNFTKTHYYYSPETDRYIEIPAQNGMLANHKAPPLLTQDGKSQWDAKGNQAKMLAYFEKMAAGKPGMAKDKVDAWENLAYALTIGYTRYLEQADTPKEVLFAIRACTDSRTPPRAILGYDDADGCTFYVSRAPGNPLVDENLVYTRQAELFDALAELASVSVVNTAHSECGAMTAATKLNKEFLLPEWERKLNMPGPFVDYAKSCTGTFVEAMDLGQTEEERTSQLSANTQMPIGNDHDGVSAQQLLRDERGAAMHKGARTHHIFHHTGKARIYIMTQLPSGRMSSIHIAVPTIPGMSRDYNPRAGVRAHGPAPKPSLNN